MPGGLQHLVSDKPQILVVRRVKGQPAQVLSPGPVEQPLLHTAHHHTVTVPALDVELVGE